MSHPLVRTAVGMVTFMLLDAIWLGFLLNAFYRDRTATIARIANGRFAPNWPAAIVVYVLLGTGIALFVTPRASGAASAAAHGALLGLVVYGVYDFTNFSMLRLWPLDLALVDTAWGVLASAIVAAVVQAIAR